MVWSVRAFAALAKDLCVAPSTHTKAHNCLNPVPGDMVPSSGLHGHKEHTWCTYIVQAECSNTKN